MVDEKMHHEHHCIVPLTQEEVTIIQMSLLGEKECHMKLCDGAKRAGDHRLAESLRYYTQTVLPSLSTLRAGDVKLCSSQLIAAWFAVERFYKQVVKPHHKAQKKNPVAFAMTSAFGAAIAPTKSLLSKLAEALAQCEQGAHAEHESEVVTVVVATPVADASVEDEVQQQQGQEEQEGQVESQKPQVEENANNVEEIAEALRRLRNSQEQSPE
jgi:hypothetical protein